MENCIILIRTSLIRLTHASSLAVLEINQKSSSTCLKDNQVNIELVVIKIINLKEVKIKYLHFIDLIILYVLEI